MILCTRICPLINNRSFAAFGAGLLLSLFAACPAVAFDHDKVTTEPYALAGNRIVFTTWYFVRPGQLDWLGPDGKSMTSDRTYGHMDGKHALYDGPRGVRLEVEPAQPTGPIIRPEKPWEAMGISIGAILKDEDKYRLWGSCQDAKGTRYTCYLESTDLENWQRPNLGQVEFDGSRDNNLVAELVVGSVFRDPVGPSEERYKAVWHGDFDPQKFVDYKNRRLWSVMATKMDPGRVHSVRGAVSPDGLHWTELPNCLSAEMSDTNVVAYYDEVLRKYVMYTRNYMLGPRSDGFDDPISRRSQFLGRRAIGRSESESFHEFPLSEVIVETGSDMPPTDSYYTNGRTAIPGAPDHHLLFPAIYHLDRDTTSIDMQASYDGKLWHRLPGSPVLRTADFGEWDGGCVFATPSLLELSNGDWALPFTGYDVPHKYPRAAWNYRPGLAVWPKGRLAAIVADDEGFFTTTAVVAPGSRLLINAVTDRAGEILIEAADLAGEPIPGRTFDEAIAIVGDQHWTPVKWEGDDDLGVERGAPIELRIKMRLSRIYGLQFE